MSILGGILFTVPLFMQVSYGITAFATGVALMPLTVSVILGAVLGVRMARRRLPRTVVRLGALVETVGALTLVIRMNSGTSPLDLALGLTILGFGNGLIGSQIVNLVLSSIPTEETAEASGTNSTMEQVGNSVGVALLGTLLTLSLTLGVAQQLAANTTLSAPVRDQVQLQIEQGLSIVSNEQLTAGLESIESSQASEILAIYNSARTNAFRINMLVVAFCGLLMFVMSRSLPAKTTDEMKE